MKKLIILLSVVFALTNTSKASHLMGGEITAVHIGNGQYVVMLTIFRDMSGISIGTTPQTITVFNNPNLQSLTLQYDSTWVHPLFGLQNGQPIPNFPYGVDVYFFVDTISLSPATMDLTWGTCCRNGAISNLTNPGASGMTLAAELMVDATNNSTPVFLTPPVVAVPLDSAWQYNPLPFDADGDSLVWSFTDPYDNGIAFPPSLIPYTSPPSHLTGPFSIDPITGTISWTANVIGNYAMTVLCEEFRNGSKIGEIRRDMQYIVVPDSVLFMPTIYNMNSIPNNGAGYPYIATQANQPLNFSLMVNNQNNNVSMQAYGEPFLLDNNTATFSTINDNNDVVGTFDWTPTNNEVRTAPYFIVIRSSNGTFSYDETIQIEVSSITAVSDFTISKQLLKVMDILGRDTKPKRNTPLFYIYDDGTVEKRIIIE